MPVKFSEEFKRDAVALVLTQGMSQKQVCADMGISKSALQAWVRNVELAGRGIAPAASKRVVRPASQALATWAACHARTVPVMRACHTRGWRWRGWIYDSGRRWW